MRFAREEMGHHIRWTSLIIFILCIGLVLGSSACSSTAANTTPELSPDEQPLTPAPDTRPTPDLLKAPYAEVGKPAIDFALSDLDGNTVWLSDYLGKVVIISFWATWCPPCQAEIPELVSLYPELQADNVVILAVNFREAPDTVSAFVEEEQMNFPVLLDSKGLLAYAYGVRALPTSLFVDRKGVLRYSYLGGLTEGTLKDILAGIDQG